MSKNTSLSLGDLFESYITSQVDGHFQVDGYYDASCRFPALLLSLSPAPSTSPWQ